MNNGNMLHKRKLRMRNHGGQKNGAGVEKFLNHELELKPEDQYEAIEVP